MTTSRPLREEEGTNAPAHAYGRMRQAHPPLPPLSDNVGLRAGNAAGVSFTAKITDGLVTDIAYQADNGGQTATVSTRLSEIGSAGSVDAPTEGT